MENRNYNYGLSILRVFMTFEVVLAHLLDFSKYNIALFKFLELLTPSAVPVFMIISFYFSYKLFVQSNNEPIINRIKKLLIPHIGWTLIYFFIYKLINIAFNKNSIGISDLFYQLLLGHSPKLNYAMWFQVVLILLTILYCLLHKLATNKIHYVLLVLFVLCFVFQYTNINYLLFANLIEELSNPLGRIIEVIPYSIIGYFFYKYDLLNRFKNNMKLYLFVLLVLLVAIVTEYLFNPIHIEGFGYQGIRLMFISLFIFVLFGSINLNHVNIDLLKLLTKHTSGIYYMHLLLGKLLEFFPKAITKNSFVECVIVYILGYLISSIITKSSNKYIKQLVSN